jgi:hypothetical protein
MIAGWGAAILITALDLYSLPEVIPAAWKTIVGG